LALPERFVQKTPRDLTCLCEGEQAVIFSLHSQGRRRRRLMDLGLVPGTCVKAVRRSPGGNLIAINIRGAVIALRLEACREILVTESAATRR